MYLHKVQSDHANRLASANLESKSLEIFFQYIVDEQKTTQQKLALKALRHVSDDLRIELTALVENDDSNDTEVRIEAQNDNKTAAENVLQVAQESPTLAKAKITRPTAGMNLRARPLSGSELAQTVGAPDKSIGDVICSLQVGHEIEIIEEAERWTVVRTTCPDTNDEVTGYISHYAGSPPLEILE